MDILRIMSESTGFFTRADARAAGMSDKQMAAAVRLRHWIRFRRGSYCHSDIWTHLDEVERHRVRSRAVIRSLGPSVALSHQSASVFHGVSIWGMPLDRVHVTRLDNGAGRIEGDVVHHEGRRLDSDVVEIDGDLVMTPARAAIEAVSRFSSEVALAHFDNVLHRGLATHDELFAQFQAMERWPYTQHLHLPVRAADGRSASIGESRGRYLFRRAGLPAPIPQFQVFDHNGILVATCDWGWPEHGLLGEFDGRVKYGRLLKPGQDVGAVVFAEKQREDLVRELTDSRMIRLIWSDYQRPRVTSERLRTKLRLAG